MEPVIITDGDVSCHLACFQEWQTKLKQLKDFGVTERDEIKEVTSRPSFKNNAKSLDRCWAEFKKAWSNMTDALYSDRVVSAVKAGDGFRDRIYVDYKGYRKREALGNPFVDSIRQRAMEEGYMIPAEGREADDYIRTWAEESRAHGVPYFIASNDKDLYCIPGKHYNLKTLKTITITPLDAMRHYYSQILQGDATDGIPGLPGIGPKTAEKLVADLTSHKEAQELVVGMYLEAYQDAWHPYLLANAKLIHIQRSLNDYLDLMEWPIVKELR